jgi:hypothetical protein
MTAFGFASPLAVRSKIFIALTSHLTLRRRVQFRNPDRGFGRGAPLWHPLPRFPCSQPVLPPRLVYKFVPLAKYNVLELVESERQLPKLRPVAPISAATPVGISISSNGEATICHSLQNI